MNIFWHHCGINALLTVGILSDSDVGVVSLCFIAMMVGIIWWTVHASYGFPWPSWGSSSAGVYPIINHPLLMVYKCESPDRDISQKMGVVDFPVELEHPLTS
jgi:hypothetical protein